MPSLSRRACLLAALLLPLTAFADDLVNVVKRVKPAIVAVGTYEPTRSPAVEFRGTGFAVGDGLSIITNAHVLPPALDEGRKETLGIFTGEAGAPHFRPATVEAIDREHDLAHLRIRGQPLATMELQDSEAVEEGQSLAFTGFPLGLLLGLRHVTHKALLSAKTPISVPATNAKQLDAKMIAQMQRSPFAVFQLDATAYPGSSGSPLYDPSTGGVVGIINMVYVKGVKENAISNPSGITYAIPSNYIRKLIANK
jgi:S1-C subfamily serine protease